MSARQVLVVDDEANMRRVLEIMLKKMGHRVACAANGEEALRSLRQASVDLVITDLRMPQMSGIELLRKLRADGIPVPVIVITAHGTIESAVDAMKLGACDYILRPFDVEALELTIGRVLAAEGMARANDFLRDELNKGWEEFIGSAPAMAKVYEAIRQVAPTKTSVMITGETGTGKELAARSIHHASQRGDKLFVPINCAAIPADILESELFGYEKGAFTGAVKDRVGKFELANEGTIFLDELAEMPVSLQAKLLRVLQESTIERLGGNRVVNLDIRVIAATNKDPRRAIDEGKLREDLFYRVNVFSIALPPLRAHREDIPALVRHFIAKHSVAGRVVPSLSPEAESRLVQYSWPGNVRELENVVERALVLSTGPQLEVGHFPLETEFAREPARAPAVASAEHSLNRKVEDLEASMIRDALERVGGNKAKAASLLDISERSLWYKLKKYGLD